MFGPGTLVRAEAVRKARELSEMTRLGGKFGRLSNAELHGKAIPWADLSFGRKTLAVLGSIADGTYDPQLPSRVATKVLAERSDT